MVTGKHIKLRAIEFDDLKTLAQWKNDPEIPNFFYEYTLFPLKSQEEWFDRQRNNPSEINLVAENHNGDLIGTGSIIDIDWRNRKAEVGRVLIGSKDKRNSGLGVEIVLLLFNYAFQHLNLHKVYGDALCTNKRIRRLHHALGVKEDGLLREHVFSQGRYVDVVTFSLLRSEFEQCKITAPTQQLYNKHLLS